jgi:hypothetical protein
MALTGADISVAVLRHASLPAQRVRPGRRLVLSVRGSVVAQKGRYFDMWVLSSALRFS